MGFVLAFGDYIAPRCGGGHCIETWGGLDLGTFSIDPDTKALGFAADHDGFIRASNCDDDLQRGFGYRSFALNCTKHQNIRAIKICGNRNAVFAQAEHHVLCLCWYDKP